MDSVSRQQSPRTPGDPLRRRPAQRRSARRVERMLDACAELLDEGGYDALTTTRVAERAGVAIGSVYQFFPDKRAVVQALAQRHLETYLRRLDERLPGVRPGDWWRIVDTAVAEYVRLHRRLPGFRTVHLGDVVGTHLLDGEREDHEVIAGRLAEVLAARAGVPDGERTRFALTIAVETIDTLVALAFRRDPTGDAVLLAEARTLIHDYLRHRLPVSDEAAPNGMGREPVPNGVSRAAA